MTDQLARGDLDFAMLPVAPNDAGLKVRYLPAESFVTLARKGHPRLTPGSLTLDGFLGESHVLVSPGGDANGIVDLALSQQGRSRRVTTRTRYFITAPFLVAQSDLITTVPWLLAASVLEQMPLVAFRPPIPLPDIRNVLVWHDSVDKESGSVWMRNTVIDGATVLADAARQRFEQI